jgi:hypothetical protein
MATGASNPQIFKSLDVTTALYMIVDTLDGVSTKIDDLDKKIIANDGHNVNTDNALRELKDQLKKLDKTLNDPTSGLIVELANLSKLHRAIEDEKVISKVRYHGAMIKIMWLLLVASYGILGKLIFF